MKTPQISDLSAEAIDDLDRLYRSTRDVRLRTRAQIGVPAAEKGLVAAEIAAIVRADELTVRHWLERYHTQGLFGLFDLTRPGGPRKDTDAFPMKLTETARSDQPASNCPMCFGRMIGWPTTWPRKPCSEYLSAK